VRDGSPLPLFEPDFLFRVPSAVSASVTPVGIHCDYKADLQLFVPANAVELDVVNGAENASISAWVIGSAGLQLGRTEQVPSATGVQLIRFDFSKILLIAFESMGELYLQAIR
jgi:hypothetical protein